ncbi:MAG: DUF1957 domain-containing protein, partial [Nitrospiraceae bacterium]|nr:DUF1957 domain-containing protein [Nitrospiraceae bacterium]
VREMLLAQSSDWLFLMQKNRARAYAEKRLADHIKNFLSIFDQVMQNRIDDAMLSELERQSPYPAGYCLQDFRSIKCFS